MTNANLLVVDDNEFNRDMLSRRLRREGYTVDVAENGYQALEMLRDRRYDLVLLDIMMPGISGLEILTTIRETRSIAELPVILATAKDQSEDIVEGLKLGANDYITKPIDFPVLLARLRLHLQLRNLSQLKDEFLRIASHDLKNPLSTILMSAYIAIDRIPPGEVMTAQVHNMLTFIVRRGEEMQRIIKDFLDFQAMEDGNFTLERYAINLNTIATNVIESNASYASGKSITLHADLDPELPYVSADEARLMQVAQNLVGNAIKFCPAEARVVVTTRLDNGCVMLEVCDSGPGLMPEDMDKLFVKYARLANKPTGGENSSGLGLAICKRMIELHGGKIGARNNPDRGATFWFSLPIT
ncbi:MAG: HAMP domain-containing histidine kinase [Anaerolineae bacterium]|nr:HAMP domain-containing histidine kinase [Anaerolineae bacterium]